MVRIPRLQEDDFLPKVYMRLVPEDERVTTLSSKNAGVVPSLYCRSNDHPSPSSCFLQLFAAVRTRDATEYFNPVRLGRESDLRTRTIQGTDMVKTILNRKENGFWNKVEVDVTKASVRQLTESEAARSEYISLKN